jgi:hypothetical protein
MYKHIPIVILETCHFWHCQIHLWVWGIEHSIVSAISIIKSPLGTHFLYVISYDTMKGALSSQSKGLMHK